MITKRDITIKKNIQIFWLKIKKNPFFLFNKIFRLKKVHMCKINSRIMYVTIAILRIALDKSKLLSPKNTK